MQDEAPVSGDEAAAWLRDHFAGESEPSVSIVIEVTEPNDAVFYEVLDILFGPDAGDIAA